jgi:hypothetical protein
MSFAADVVEYRSRQTSAPVSYVAKPLADAFSGIGAGRKVQQSPVGLVILHDGVVFPC